MLIALGKRNPYPYSVSGIPGALGRGQSTGVALSNFFKFWAYFCTVIGAVVAGELSTLRLGSSWP
jgi:hypothetical protein